MVLLTVFLPCQSLLFCFVFLRNNISRHLKMMAKEKKKMYLLNSHQVQDN